MAEQGKVAGTQQQQQQPVKPVQPAQAAAFAPQTREAEPVFRIEAAKKRKRYLNALFYGDYGVGKTYLAGTSSLVPSMRDVLFISAESGDMSIEHFDLDVVTVTNYGQLARVYEFLKLHCQYRDSGDEEKLIKLESIFRGLGPNDPPITRPKKYRTVVIDSLTEVHKYCMYQLLGIKLGDFALDLEPEAPQWSEWGKSSEMTLLLIRSFRDLPMHKIIVCGRQEEQDERKQFHYNADLPGKLANRIQGFFDLVGYLVAAPTEGGEMQRRIYVTPGKTYKAKNRFKDFTASYIDNPTMADFAKLEVRDN